MSDWVRLTKTDKRPIDVNLRKANSILRDERDYATLISFGPSDSVTVLETPGEIFEKSRSALDQTGNGGANATALPSERSR